METIAKLIFDFFFSGDNKQTRKMQSLNHSIGVFLSLLYVWPVSL